MEKKVKDREFVIGSGPISRICNRLLLHSLVLLLSLTLAFLLFVLEPPTRRQYRLSPLLG